MWNSLSLSRSLRALKFVLLMTYCFFPSQGESADLELSLPEGQSMHFQRVCIGEDNSLFAGKRFTMGDPTGGFKESPTAVTIGGAFLHEADTGTDWCFYMSTTEVTWGQYRAITSDAPANTKDLSQKDSYPVHNVSWFEVQEYIDTLNQWFYANNMAELPSYQQGVAFFRLPTEEEWEFAARGGIQVSPDTFDKRTPYPPGKLSAYEWYSGPKSSHNKIKKAGVLKPNPLGLYDMLGNVSEMTMSLYRVEYYQGRVGGFAARGGHYLTSEKQLRSSARTEQPFYTVDKKTQSMKSNSQKTLGFRLVLSSILYPNRSVAQSMDTEWDSYRKTRGKSLPAAVSVAPLNQQINVEFEDAAKHIERLKKLLQNNSDQQTELIREVEFIEASFSKTEKIRAKASEDSAYAWVLIAGERALTVRRQFQRNLKTFNSLLVVAKRNNNPAKAEKYEKRIEEVKANIENLLDGYSTAIRQLGTLDIEAIKKGLKDYNRYLMSRNATEQVTMLPVLSTHITAFNKDQRVDRNRWYKDLTQQTQ